MRFIVALICLWAFAAPVSALAQERPQQAMIVAADPRAVAAGAEMLARGGSAVDAAIATMAVLGLVEPQSAGIGGGGFLLHHDGRGGALTFWDGRETAPAGARPDMFLGPDGRPLPTSETKRSGRAIGAPSLIAMLKAAHEAHGLLAWRELFEPAIRLADQGFAVSPRLHRLVAAQVQKNDLRHDAARYLLGPDGQAWPVGAILRNPDYAASLRLIAARGPRALKEGALAQAIVARAQAEPLAGSLNLADLRAYKPRKLTPICTRFRQYRVCGAPPPSSGGISVATILGLYERAQPQRGGGAGDPDNWSALLWATRLAFSDRNHYIGDDEFVPVPTYGLVAPQYWDVRSRFITPLTAPSGPVLPGDPAVTLGGESLRQRWALDPALGGGGTTHLSIIDARGNAVSLTATVEDVFGSHRMAGGFFLNNQLTDFAAAPVINGKPVANAVAPGKRPRSSMAPTIVFDEASGRVVMIAGSPGGPNIIPYVAKTLIAVLDWGVPPAEAVALGHINAVQADNGLTAEMDRAPKPLIQALQQRGWTIRPFTSESSGLNIIVFGPDGPIGAADPRREGVAAIPALARTGR